MDRPSAGGAGREDGGFTLVEVIVSLLLLAVVLSAALSLFVRALANTDLQAQRGQAITIANDKLEQVRGLPVGNLLDGRTQAAVQALWTSWDPSGTGPTKLSVQAYDATATSSSTPLVPLVTTNRIDNVNYVVRIFVDNCYLPTTGSTTCGTTQTSANKMLRISVSVAWSPRNSRGCDTTRVVAGTAELCQEYVVTTLRDPSSEATFNTN